MRELARWIRSLPKWLLLSGLSAFLLVIAIESVLWVRFYLDAVEARDSLVALKTDVNIKSLNKTPAELRLLREDLLAANSKTQAARAHVDRDPLLLVARQLPLIGDQAKGLTELIRAADTSATAGVHASEVLLAYADQSDDSSLNAIQEGVRFIEEQAPAMARVRADLDALEAHRRQIPGGLIGPLDRGAADLDEAIGRLDGLVEGYERAHDLLPDLLGFRGPRTYLVLPQNDTELFPSGGLISSYGIVTFDQGRVGRTDFEHFVNLFERWQEISGGEYVEPPAPLKSHLLRDISFALGEAGWYPDFPTTAALAASFVNKGGNTARLDGTIALDLHFVQALLEQLGPLEIDGTGVTLTSANLSEITLEETRLEQAVPGATGKSFLGLIANELLTRIFATSAEGWVDLLQLMDRMGDERHLQLNFVDDHLQGLATEYGVAGDLIQQEGDFLMLADTSVKSTKLNLILNTSIDVKVNLSADGIATTQVTYTIMNPFPEWRRGRDPRLVSELMLEGVYGSYSRVYTHRDARLLGIDVDGTHAGPEDLGTEFNRAMFGRFMAVGPGLKRSVRYTYQNPSVIESNGATVTYDLYVQKQPGTGTIPLTFQVELPESAANGTVDLDGVAYDARSAVTTDLRVDRQFRVEFSVND